MNNYQMPVLLTIKDVSERLKLSQLTVRKLISSGSLSAMKLGHRTVRVSEIALMVWLEGRVI